LTNSFNTTMKYGLLSIFVNIISYFKTFRQIIKSNHLNTKIQELDYKVA
jgi:hypothetical protein